LKNIPEKGKYLRSMNSKQIFQQKKAVQVYKLYINQKGSGTSSIWKKGRERSMGTFAGLYL
jgi:hypothetical protein